MKREIAEQRAVVAAERTALHRGRRIWVVAGSVLTLLLLLLTMFLYVTGWRHSAGLAAELATCRADAGWVGFREGGMVGGLGEEPGTGWSVDPLLAVKIALAS